MPTAPATRKAPAAAGAERSVGHSADRLLERLPDQARELRAVPEPLALPVAPVLALVDQGEEEAPAPEVGERVAHDALDLPDRGVVGREPGLELGVQARDALEHDGQVERA